MQRFKAGRYPVQIDDFYNRIIVGCQTVPFSEVIRLAEYLKTIQKSRNRIPPYKYMYRQEILQNWNEIPVLGYPQASERRTI